jgi:hypothetical protein
MSNLFLYEARFCALTRRPVFIGHPSRHFLSLASLPDTVRGSLYPEDSPSRVLPHPLRLRRIYIQSRSQRARSETQRVRRFRRAR